MPLTKTDSFQRRAYVIMFGKWNLRICENSFTFRGRRAFETLHEITIRFTLNHRLRFSNINWMENIPNKNIQEFRSELKLDYLILEIIGQKIITWNPNCACLKGTILESYLERRSIPLFDSQFNEEGHFVHTFFFYYNSNASGEDVIKRM